MSMIEIKGSIFDATELDPAVAEQLKIKAGIAKKLSRYIQRRKMTQTEAAKAMKVSRTRVNEMVNGRIDKFTIDALVAMAANVKLYPVQVTDRAA